MRTSNRPPELLANVRTSVAFDTPTKFAFVSKPSAEPPKAETDPDDALVKLQDLLAQGPQRLTGLPIPRASALVARDFQTVVEKKPQSITHQSRGGDIHIHTLLPTPRQKPAPTTKPYQAVHTRAQDLVALS